MTLTIDLTAGLIKSPKKLLWMTDLHLDAAEKGNLQQFFQKIEEAAPSALLIGGDISNGYQSLIHLNEMVLRFKIPLYFVLGNHDYYHASIEKMRTKVSQLTKEIQDLIYLTDAGVIELNSTTALIGHDGWYDGRAGDFLNSDILLNDYFLIEELTNLSPTERLAKLNEMGAEAGRALSDTLHQALSRYSKVILLTHIPPFLESCVHDGQMCDANWGPHMVSLATGEALLAVMKQHPDKELLVLCGHTHSAADVTILPNLRVVTGSAVLKEPSIQGEILF
jgi:Icc protein